MQEAKGVVSCRALGGTSLEETGTFRGCPRDARIVTCEPQKHGEIGTTDGTTPNTKMSYSFGLFLDQTQQ